MKKAEAISILATSVRPREAKDRERYDKAVNMAIEALKAQELKNVPDTNVGGMISRQAAIDAIDAACMKYDISPYFDDKRTDEEKRIDWWEMGKVLVKALICDLPSVQPETCEGCKHMGKWENEVEYGYPSPCTCCKRRVEDNYE